MPCVFPFHYKGKEYSQCIRDESKKNDGAWCATNVEGEEIVDWGYCAEDKCAEQTVEERRTSLFHPCNTTEEVPCIFPFRYKNTLYAKCIAEDNGGVLWCSTRTVDW